MAAEEGSAAHAIREAMKGLRDAAPLLGVNDETFDKACGEIASTLRGATGEFGDIELQVATNRITVGEDIAFRSEAKENNVAFDLFRQGLRRIIFKPGLTDEEVTTFVIRFAECRSADQVDEDFVSTLWREQLPNIQYIALDGFTEKIFMSEADFVGAFRGVIDDVVPGLTTMEELDPGDEAARARETQADAQATESADTWSIRLRKQLVDDGPPLVQEFRAADDELDCFDHLAHLLGCLMVKHPSPLSLESIAEAITRLLVAYLEKEAWERFADATRTLRQLIEQAETFDATVAVRLRQLYEAIAGDSLVESVAHTLDPENTDYTAWCRWHFVSAGVLKAPALLTIINRATNPPGVDFLKDLLRRQGTESLDPWVERLKDPNAGVVLEVLDVILGSDLGVQARPMFIETLKHQAPEVRAKAVEGLSGTYDLTVREALLPLLRDPSSKVRKAIVSRFVAFKDKSVATYLGSAIRSSLFFEFDEDEQRLYFEALAKLGGARFMDVYREQLHIDDGGGGGFVGKLLKRGQSTLADNPTRRAAVSGLAAMGSKDALNLIAEVKKRADLNLGSHCDVSIRLAQRGDAGGAVEALDSSAPKAAEPEEDVGIGESRMGERLVFLPTAMRVAPPTRVRPAGAPPRQEAAPAPAAEAPAPAAEPTAEVAPQPAAAPVAPAPALDLPLGERPILRDGEIFLPDDRRRLKAEPGEAADNRFRLTGVRGVLVGPPASAAAQTRATEPPKPVMPVRIVERSTPTAHADWTHQPDTTVEDILQSYLTGGPAPVEPPASEPPPEPATSEPPVAPPLVAPDSEAPTGLFPLTPPPLTTPPVTAPPVTAPPLTAPPLTPPPLTAPPLTPPPLTGSGPTTPPLASEPLTPPPLAAGASVGPSPTPPPRPSTAPPSMPPPLYDMDAPVPEPEAPLFANAPSPAQAEDVVVEPDLLAPEPSEAAQAEAAAPSATVDDMLKDFLQLDLGD